MPDVLRAETANFLVEVGIALLGLLTAYVVRFLGRASARLEAEAKTIKDQALAQLAARAIRRLDDLVGRVVVEIEQTVAGDLRQRVKEGKASRHELLDLAHDAYKKVVDTIEPELWRVLDEQLGDVESYVRATIEAKVRELKTVSAPSQV